jgi:hypothetical protein
VEKMRKCLTPDDYVVTPVGYFAPARSGLLRRLLLIQRMFIIVVVSFLFRTLSLFVEKMRKCLTPDDYVVTPVGYFAPARSGLLRRLSLIQRMFTIVVVSFLFRTLSLFVGKFAAQIYKFFMTIPIFLDLFHSHTFPSADVF